MIRPFDNSFADTITTRVLHGHTLQERMPELIRFINTQHDRTALSYHPAWLNLLANTLGHQVYAVEATLANHTCGYLPLAYVESWLFGKFLSSLPYLNSNGVMASTQQAKTLLIDCAITLADEYNVKHLELRQEQPIEHAQLNGQLSTKVQMRRDLPENTEQLWKELDTKVRNQIRKGDKHHLQVRWGGNESLIEFYGVLSRNMRDLGTPFYSRDFFRAILTTFPKDAEVGICTLDDKPIAVCLLLHGQGITEVPTASSLREYNSTCANMWLYHQMLCRSIERRQGCFDFGRSTVDHPTFRFKKQWGAKPFPTVWQYYLRTGQLGEMRPDNPRYQRLIALWKRLPVWMAQLFGPMIVRGIP